MALLAIGVAVLLGVHTWLQAVPYVWVHAGSLLLVFLLSIGTFYQTDRSLRGSHMAFMSAVVGGMMLKMFFSLVYIGMTAAFTVVPPLALAMVYMSAFLLFTALEVHALLNNLRLQNSSQEERQ